ncbi:MAG: Hsp70 family protein [Roseivivax sp.]|nr:Hsp70 family protein [Roseivivax sp.]
MPRLAVDFGTSNTAAALMAGNRPWPVPLEPGEATLPTALFFDSHTGAVLFGRRAVAALIEGREGRFLRALKSVLGTPLLREQRMIGGARTTLLEVVARFLTHVRTGAEAQVRMPLTAVLSGRPVIFRSRDEAENAQAARDLEEAYRMAGFTDIAFMAEPEAAALASGGAARDFGLVVDIGGGTSDFTVFRGTGEAIEIVASQGLKLGGTDFDRALNIDRVMPLLGLGSQLRREFGPGTTEAPRALFNDLATWERIPFQYTPENRRAVAQMARLAEQPSLWARLADVLELELAHDIAHAVEGAKIAANTGAGAAIGLTMVERGLTVPLTSRDLGRVLGGFAEDIAAAAVETVSQAGLPPQALTRIVMVGGSSLLGPVEDAVRARLPGAVLDRSDPFTAIVDGLAIAAARMDAA